MPSPWTHLLSPSLLPLSSNALASMPVWPCLRVFECAIPLPGKVPLIPHMADPLLCLDLTSDISKKFFDFWFPVQDVRTLEVSFAPILTRKNLYKLKINQLFLDPSENGGHRENHCPQNYRNRKEGTENNNLLQQKFPWELVPGQENPKLMNCWGLSVDSFQRDTVIGDPNTFVSFTFRGCTRFSQWRSEKNPLMLLSWRGGKQPFWKITEHLFSLRACPQEKLFYYSLTCWGFIRA